MKRYFRFNCYVLYLYKRLILILGWTWLCDLRRSSNTMKAYTNGSIPPQYFFDTNYILQTTYVPQKFSKIRFLKSIISIFPQKKIFQSKVWINFHAVIVFYLQDKKFVSIFKKKSPKMGFELSSHQINFCIEILQNFHYSLA